MSPETTAVLGLPDTVGVPVGAVQEVLQNWEPVGPGPGQYHTSMLSSSRAQVGFAFGGTGTNWMQLGAAKVSMMEAVDVPGKVVVVVVEVGAGVLEACESHHVYAELMVSQSGDVLGATWQSGSGFS